MWMDTVESVDGMASVRKIERKTGIAYQVRWRERTTGTQTSETFDSLYNAEMLKRFLDANGNTYSLAAEAYRLSHAEGPLLEDVAAAHFDSLTHVYPRTVKEYRRDFRLHTLPHLGHIRVSQLTAVHVRDWIEKLKSEGCAPKSIRNYFSELNAMMKLCMRDGIRDTNPCDGQRLPRPDKRARRLGRYLEVEEYEQFLECFEPRWRVYVETLAGTGVRWGEFAAFNVSDFHPARGGHAAYLTVDKAIKTDDQYRKYIGEPKTENAYRDIPIDDHLGDEIAEICRGRGQDEPIFRGASGHGRVTYENFLARVWKPTVREAMEKGVPNIKIHGLRHSHGSWLAAEGVDLALISKRLGHDSIQETVDTYGHITARQNRAAVDALARLRRR